MRANDSEAGPQFAQVPDGSSHWEVVWDPCALPQGHSLQHLFWSVNRYHSVYSLLVLLSVVSSANWPLKCWSMYASGFWDHSGGPIPRTKSHHSPLSHQFNRAHHYKLQNTLFDCFPIHTLTSVSICEIFLNPLLPEQPWQWRQVNVNHSHS